jgi:signal transduction histidine kinase
VAGWGIVATLVAIGIGRVLERARLGPTDDTALQHVAADARRAFADLAGGLAATARHLAATPSLVAEGTPDVARRRALFDVTARRLTAAGARLDALSVYDAAGRPLAWAGRPTTLPADRLAGAAAVFVAPGPSGLSLVHVEPVVDGGPSGRRVGAVVAEAILTRGGAAGDPVATPIFTSSLVPLSLRAARFEGGASVPSATAFALAAPDGAALLTADVPPGALAALRARDRTRTLGAALVVLALTCVLLAFVAADAADRETGARRYTAWLLAIAALLLGARALLGWAVPTGWRWSAPVAGLEHPWLHSPADWLATALVALALVFLLVDVTQRTRLARAGVARAADTEPAAFWVVQAAAGAMVGVILLGHAAWLGGAVRASGTHGLTFGVYPFDLRRLALVVGLICGNAAALWLAVATLRLAATWWRVSRRAHARRLAMGAVFVGAALGTAAWLGAPARGAWLAGLLPPLALVVAATGAARWVVPRYRHASQATRLTAAYLALALPTVAFYPALVTAEQGALERTVATEYAPEVLNHRDELRQRLSRSRDQLDALPTLVDQFVAEAVVPGAPLDADRAYFLWSRTELGHQRLTSSIELYGADGVLLSRFALNLPAEFLATERPSDADCTWDVFGEALASTDDQVLLHAGRAVCLPDGRRVGAILVHVVLDYGTLPFVADLDPAAALARGGPPRDRATHGRSIGFAVYGWGRTPVFPTAGTAWPISTELLLRIYRADRRAFWEVLTRGDERWRVLLSNDRAGIYAIGYALPRPIDHAVTLAEVVTLAGLTFVVLVAGIGGLSRLAGRHPITGRALLREIRRSFYRKLFLLFVAAAVVPVLALALVTRNYVAGQLREGLESGAVRTASAARRVIETVVSQQRRDRSDPVAAVTDEVMVSVSRIIDQDVNVFVRETLVATSQRDLFASGLLPTRIPAEVARAIGLERQSSYVGDERLGQLQYTIAAVPVRDGESGAILTVPLTLRQQEIEGEITALDRRVILAAVVFILLGAAVGYVTAERLGDPIQRLTRATGRIARGDLSARILASRADELGRLVQAFNQMGEDLQRQRAELERTNRLAAWADMARQVAHDIKNPLTPIQLQAEFLRRVHRDSGAPLGTVVDSCVATILSQVSLLRSIASEFSSFASSPVARFAPTRLDEVVDEVLAPYQTGLPANVELKIEHAPGVPELFLDRGLLARALVNVIENALHAMRGGGSLMVRCAPHDGGARIAVSDTGAGMEPEALERLFEPYFSTKATGTGLGLTIAKRNVELNGGVIAVASEKGRGTTVTITLPARARPDAGSGSPASR